MPRGRIGQGPRRAGTVAAALLALLALPVASWATATGPARPMHAPKIAPVQRNAPVFYTADSAIYNRDAGIVTLAGHVEVWQGERVLRADKVTYDRNTDVAAARGHVVLLDPTGQVLFADYAELSQGMKDGIVTDFRAQLAENGKLAANGGRRINGEINELSRAIYSSCDICRKHPERPLEWDVRARSAVQDVPDKRIEYYDAVVDMFGVPVAYFPYLTMPDPSARRASGVLIPNIGYQKYLGAFTAIPYYWAIDGASDATFTPILTQRNGPALDLQYRRAFNNGTVTVNTSAAYDRQSLQSDLFANGQFALNNEWRWGFDLQRATSETYMQDYEIPGLAYVLTSSVYLEGFGQGSYSRLDARAYQGLVASLQQTELPYVLPRYEYSFTGQPDALGGRTTVQAGAFNVLRQEGTNTRRVNLSLNWDRPFSGAYGDLWHLVLHLDSAAYDADKLNQQPTWSYQGNAVAAQAMPTVALEGRWPFVRHGGGTQIIEPIVQLIAAPNGSSYGTVFGPNGAPLYLNTLIPNEDSFDFEFTDATLFSLNRFSGVDRLEGGPRANVALHGTWYFGNGQDIDALIGQGYRLSPDRAFPVGSGLNDTVTDVVSHIIYTPNQYLDFTSRQRFDHQGFGLRFFDGLASTGPDWLKFNVGYIYDRYNPYTYYDTVPSGVLGMISPVNKSIGLNAGPINEVTFGGNVKFGHWRLSATTAQDVYLRTNDYYGGTLTYEDECFVFSANFFRRNTSINGDNGATILYFQIGLKTLGSFNVNGL